MSRVWKIASYVALVLYFFSYYWGYAREAELALLLLGVLITPYGSYRLLSRAPASEKIATPEEKSKLFPLKKKMYLAVGLVEFLLLSFLAYRLTEHETFEYLYGAIFILLVLNILNLSNAKCPRCQKNFFRSKKRTSKFTVTPGSARVHYNALQLDITPECVECGLSWNA